MFVDYDNVVVVVVDVEVQLVDEVNSYFCDYYRFRRNRKPVEFFEELSLSTSFSNTDRNRAAVSAAFDRRIR